MPPKKAAAVAAASADPSPAEASPEQKEKTKTDAAKLRKIADHPSVRNMVMEALKVLDSRKGVSNQAIQNYIKQKWLMDPVRLKHFVRKELTKGLENGSYVRPPGSTVTTGTHYNRPVCFLTECGSQCTKSLKSSQGWSQEDPKPSKKAKKAEEASSSKVAPAKKPKAKKAVPKEGEGASNAAKPKAKATKVTKEKAAKADCDAPASKAPGKRGKKTAE
uniref:H15 domain-containing protein n=1 Tax=Sphaeramia orbicularis TaxID=375764 RepID=A0A672Y3D4_9TELE